MVMRVAKAILSRLTTAIGKEPMSLKGFRKRKEARFFLSMGDLKTRKRNGGARKESTRTIFHEPWMR